MGRELRDFERADSEADRALDEYIAGLPPCPGLPSTEEEVAASIARARADVAAGRYHSHAIVKEWLLTWTTPEYKPFKEWLAQRNG